MLNFDASLYNYPSTRSLVYARRGMVATGQPLAAQAGLAILQQGGNAVDAAIAAAAVLTVVEPTANGLGGDNFALVWMKDKLYGLNASGPAPQLLSLDSLQAKGHAKMPRHGFFPITVPGAPGGWAALSQRFGQLPLAQVLAPAIAYAAEGYPVSPRIAAHWQKSYRAYEGTLEGEEFAEWYRVFAPRGRAPLAGELWRSPDHARTLKLIAEGGADAFYQGEIAGRIDRLSRQYGGFIRREDLAAFKPEWVEPIHVSYRGYDVWEIPPNGHGLVALMALNLLNGFDFEQRDTVETQHRQMEAMKLAYADGLKYIAEPSCMSCTPDELLSPEYAAERRALIGSQAAEPAPGRPDRGGTIYLATADGAGNMVSLIQSNYMGFGSGIVVPGTGVALHNRGHNFSMDPEHDNALAPGKRPYHTIIPGFLTQGGEAVGPFGVMGAFMQPQGHLQVIMNTIDFHMNPQDTLDAWRWQWVGGRTIHIEPDYPEHLAAELAARGHDIVRQQDREEFGRGEIIWRDQEGVLSGGTECRTDGSIAAY